ncbi:MAG: hypothetical protein ABH871_01120 [Pseudomonadota bacterium]
MASKTKPCSTGTPRSIIAGEHPTRKNKQPKKTPQESPDIYIPPTTNLAHIEALARKPAKDRKSEEESELARLHAQWAEAGGKILFFSDAPLIEIFEMLKRGSRLMVEGNSPLLHSSLWGEIDLTRLNGYSDHYFGNLGQTQLARDLAIVTKRLPISVTVFPSALIPKKSKRGERRAALKERNWSKLLIDWRRMQYFFLLGGNTSFWNQFVNEVGYDQFALECFHGGSNIAWKVASSLLDKDTFTALGWGKQKHTNISEQAGIKAALIQGIEDEIYVEEIGYDQFALDRYQGDSQKAWAVASSLLNKGAFAALRWGKVKYTNVAEQAGTRAALMQGIENGTYIGEIGYDQFALDRYQGNSQKAWKVASSLLDKDTFAALRWGKQKHTNISEQAGIKAALMQGIKDKNYVKEVGYDQFALDRYQGNSQKAWQVAASLLDKDEFAALRWGKQKHTNISEQAGIKAALIQGIEDEIYVEEIGYDQFALDRYQGNSQKAWVVTSSLLDKDTFTALKWKKMKYTNVSEQAGMRKALQKNDYIGRMGRMLFSVRFLSGDFEKAYYVARSLLSNADYRRLEWLRHDTLSSDDREIIAKMLTSHALKKVGGNGNGSSSSPAGGTSPVGGIPSPTPSGFGALYGSGNIVGSCTPFNNIFSAYPTSMMGPMTMATMPMMLPTVSATTIFAL